MVFSAVLKADMTKTVLATPVAPESLAHEALADFYRSGWFPDFPELHPMIADNERTVVRAGGDPASPIVDFTDRTLTNSQSTLIAGPPDFSVLGRMPGISDDGRVIAFAAESAAEGTGIFVAVRNERKKVFGLAGDGILDSGEVWQDKDGDGRLESGEDHGVLSQLLVDARVAVNRTSPDRDDRYDLAFLAYGRDSRGDGRHPLGLYLARIEVQTDAELSVLGPTLVTQVGDLPGGFLGQVSNLAAYEPLNAGGELCFWVESPFSQGILKTGLFRVTFPDQLRKYVQQGVLGVHRRGQPLRVRLDHPAQATIVSVTLNNPQGDASADILLLPSDDESGPTRRI